ncbi:MAG: hypothetical protein ACK4M9_18335 [Anaerobacillus sp.]|uniref:hypothetical protein n=1 Tax=Anaerobacillus sp. TaxID=1872506 RepID=UPI00391A85B7
MMRSSKWDEKTIESQLRKLPKIEDKQSKEALFERIQERLQEEQIKERAKKKSWVIPTFAAAAVFVLLLLIIPSFLNERDATIEETYPDFRMETTELPEDAAKIMVVDERGNTGEGFSLIYFNAVQPYDEVELADQLVTLALPVSSGVQEFAVPVTLLAEGSNVIERFLTAKDTFSGEAYGFEPFPPFQINSIVEGEAGILKIDFKTGSLGGLASAQHRPYEYSLIETFRPWFEKIELSSDGEPQVDWGQYSPRSDISLRETNRGYYLFASETGHTFLVRGNVVGAPGNLQDENEVEYPTLEETLQFMKQGDDSRGYRASIPEDIVISKVNQNGKIVTITFAEGTYIENTAVNTAMVEAILFTAGDFEAEIVQFEGIEPTQVGPYFLDFVEVPKYLNFIRY